MHVSNSSLDEQGKISTLDCKLSYWIQVSATNNDESQSDKQN